ncbi:thiolase family protein [Tistrella bauzanensis]
MGEIEQAWFGNCGMGAVGQSSIRGQVCFTQLVNEGLFPQRAPIINVEGGCATASMAFHGAWKDILSAQSQLSLAIGVEKIWFPEDAGITQRIFDGGIDQLDRQEWMSYYQRAGEQAGKAFEPDSGKATVFMHTYAMQAAWHMKTWGTTREQIAFGAAKNHDMGALNPKAQYRFRMTPQEVLVDREISWPLTRSMCAPIGDGAAAALLCSGAFLRQQSPVVQERAVKVCTSVLTGGKYRALDEPSLSAVAAQRAYVKAGLTPANISVAEVHDATAFGEIFQAEMLGFCEVGKGGAFVASGATALGGVIPINLSGGLVSKGHPIGATGLSMIYEITNQLRGEAGERQRQGADIGLAENGGGVMGFDEAACSIVILRR